MKLLDSLKAKSCSLNGECKKCCLICRLLANILISAIVAIIVNKCMGGNDVKKVIKDNPKLIIESVDNFYKKEQEDRNKDMQKKAPEVAKKLESMNPVLGNKDGSKVIVEFFDYACGHCKREAMELHKVIEKHPNVKVVLADLAIMSQHSHVAAATGIYVYLQNPNKLEQYYMLMSKSEVNAESIKKVLKSIGLPENYSEKAMKDERVKEILENNFEMARTIGLQGTPALIINGKMVPGAISFNDIDAMLK